MTEFKCDTRSQYAALEQKLAASSLRVSELESENQNLLADLEKANVEIQNLKKLTEQSQNPRLEEIREKLLQDLVAHPGITANQLADAEALNPQLIKFHLTYMEKKGLVHGSYIPGEETEWSIAQDGLGYLVSHGLLA
jgi:primosomal protein N''